jgi:hypothetical protein
MSLDSESDKTFFSCLLLLLAAILAEGGLFAITFVTKYTTTTILPFFWVALFLVACSITITKINVRPKKHNRKGDKK